MPDVEGDRGRERAEDADGEPMTARTEAGSIEERRRPGDDGTQRAERRDPAGELVAEAQGVVEEVGLEGRRRGDAATDPTRTARPRSTPPRPRSRRRREPQPRDEPGQLRARIGGRRQVRDRVRDQRHGHDRERDADAEPDPPRDGRVEDGLAMSKAADPRRAGDQARSP